MFIFQFMPLRLPKVKYPKIVWTIKTIKEVIGPGCPDAVAKQILKTSNPYNIKNKIREVKRAFDLILKRSGVDYPLAPLESKRIASLFVRYPDRFLALAKSVIYNLSTAFDSLCSDKIARIFQNHFDKFLLLAKATVPKWGDYGIKALENKKIQDFFIRNPSRYVEIVRADAYHIKRFFDTYTGKKYSPLFSSHPDEIIEIAKATNGGSGPIPEFIRKRAALFNKDPSRFVELFRAAGKKNKSPIVLSAFKNKTVELAFQTNPGLFVKVIKEMNKCEANRQPIGTLDLTVMDMLTSMPNKKSILKSFSKELGKDAVTQMLDRLPKKFEDSVYARVLMSAVEPGIYSKAIRLAKSIGANYADPSVRLNFSYALKTIGEKKTSILFKKAGIEYFARYPKSVLEEVFRNLDPEHNKHKPVLMITGCKNDYLGVSYLGGQMLDLLTKYYKIMLVEVDSENGFYSAVENIGKTKPIDSLIIAGHGEADYILLGEDTEKGKLDVTDREELKKIKGFFSKDPYIIVQSCSTGKTANGIGAALSGSLDARVVAPEGIAVGLFKFNKNWSIANVSFLGGFLMNRIKKVEFYHGERSSDD
jgi:hypothetical protein